MSLVGGAMGLWPLYARAQPSRKIPVIGVLAPSNPQSWRTNESAIRARLSELGWTDGSTVTIQMRWADARNERFVEIAEEFARLRVDVIVTGASLPVLAAKRAAPNTPIVFAGVGNPVAAGLVASLARPGGNVTGVSNQTPELAGKRIELLRGVAPGLGRLAILGNNDTPSVAQEMEEARRAASALGLQHVSLAVHRTEDISPAFEGLSDRADGLYVVQDPLTGANQVLINNSALKARLPTMLGNPDYVVSGGLMSYGPGLSELFRRAADLVDKILRGAKPADIPVEQPTRFDLVINLGTARALGLTVPASLIATADEVIE
jgi:putative tryptophan/tyrosine transport system substrate-binding protein